MRGAIKNIILAAEVMLCMSQGRDSRSFSLVCKRYETGAMPKNRTLGSTYFRIQPGRENRAKSETMGESQPPKF